MVLPDSSSRPNIRSNPQLSEINLQLDTLSAKMDRKLFKSPPIARLKSAPKARTDKKIRVSNYTKARGSISKYTRKLSIKGLFNPGRPPPSRLSPVGNRNYINSASSSSRSNSKKKSHKLSDLRPKSSRNKVGHCSDNLAESTTIELVEKCCHGNSGKKVTKWKTKVENKVSYHGAANFEENCRPSTTKSWTKKSSKKTKKSPLDRSPSDSADIIGLSGQKVATLCPQLQPDSSDASTTAKASMIPMVENADPITIDSSEFTTEELETLMTSLDLDTADFLSKCEHYTSQQHDATLKACEVNCKSSCKPVCAYHCIRDLECGGLCAGSRCVIPNDDKVRERVIALLGTKIKFPVTRSIILQNSSNVRRDKLRINLEKLNQKLNEKLQDWNSRVDAIKEEESKPRTQPARKDSEPLSFSQLFAQQFLNPTRKSMAKLAENEVSDLSGCRYLRMQYTEQSQELSFLAKCEKGIRNTLRRGSVLARRLSTAAASGFPMKITIRKVERAADFSESFSSSEDTDYDEISTSSSSSSISSSSQESVGHGNRVPRMDRLVSILPARVIQRLRSQKWRNWIAKINAAERVMDIPEAPADSQ